jgi:hypothetical protein
VPAIVGADGRLAVVVGADAMKEQVHRAEARDTGHQLDAAQRVEPQVPLGRAIEVVVAGEVVMNGKEEAARSAGGVDDQLTRMVVVSSRSFGERPPARL